jgi:hypothetical protein
LGEAWNSSYGSIPKPTSLPLALYPLVEP